MKCDGGCGKEIRPIWLFKPTNAIPVFEETDLTFVPDQVEICYVYCGDCYEKVNLLRRVGNGKETNCTSTNQVEL